MIIFLTYLCCTTQQDDFQKAHDNIEAYYDMCVKIASNPEDC